MKKAVFWDFYGTLVRATSPWSNSFLEAILNHVPDSTITLEQVRPLMRGGFSWDEPDKDYREMTGDKWWEMMDGHFRALLRGLGFSGVLLDRISSDIRAEILDVKRYPVYPDAEAALRAAMDKGYGNYVLSNNFPELEQVVAELGLRSFFSGVITSSLVGFEKPNQGIFDYAKGLAGHPQACFMVGDNPVADIEGGKAAGMKTVLVHRGSDPRADYCFDSLIEIPEIL